MISSHLKTKFLLAGLIVVIVFSFISPPTSVVAATQTTIQIIIPSQSFLEGTPGTLAVDLDVQQYKSFGSYRVEILGTNIPPQFAHPEVISPVDLPARRIGNSFLRSRPIP